MADTREVPDWETLLAHAARLQTRIPGAVLVGGTAAALHARHRYSVDHDHGIRNLEKNYDESLAALESIAGWKTTRRIRGKVVLGEAEGIAAGLRNQKWAAPLDTIDVEIARGHTLRVPAVAEMLRIKAFLVVERNTTRDYLDVAALSHHLGMRKSVAAPDPYDLTDIDLAEYKGIVPPWHDWRAVEVQCRSVAEALLGA